MDTMVVRLHSAMGHILLLQVGSKLLRQAFFSIASCKWCCKQKHGLTKDFIETQKIIFCFGCLERTILLFSDQRWMDSRHMVTSSSMAVHEQGMANLRQSDQQDRCRLATVRTYGALIKTDNWCALHVLQASHDVHAPNAGWAWRYLPGQILRVP